MQEFTINATSTQELATKIEMLYKWTKKQITKYYILFTNFEKIYYHTNGKEFYSHFEDTKTTYNKAKKLKLI
jgi:hypothetical protein